jgi:transposase
MGKRYSDEFKMEAAKLYRSSEKGYAPLAEELGVSAFSLRKWVKQFATTEAVSLTEREELRKLRSEVRVLRQEREILRKAAAYVGDRCQGVGSSRF